MGNTSLKIFFITNQIQDIILITDLFQDGLTEIGWIGRMWAGKIRFFKL